MSTEEYSWPILGHKNIIEFLKKSIANNRLAHAYLFTGPKLVGKNLVAKLFIQSILCQSDPADNITIPCGKCNFCKQLLNNTHPDVSFVSRQEGQKNITIDQIRKLVQTLSLKTFLAGYKVAYIEYAEYMDSEAANALLKTLEEPLGKTIIILSTEFIENLPATIVSRCQKINFKKLPRKDIKEYLENNTQLKTAEVNNIANLSQGLPGRMFEWLDNDILYSEAKTQVLQNLKSFRNPLHTNINSVKTTIPKYILFNKKIDKLKDELNVWISIVKDLLLAKYGLNSEIDNYFASAEIEKLSDHYSTKYFYEILKYLVSAKKSLQNNPNPEITLENLYIKISNTNI